MTDGFGTITWWGFTPALDLQDEGSILSLKKLQIMDESQDKLNILLIGAGDLRHILTTVSRSKRHHTKKLHFYIIENNMELYARHMLFLALALEKQTRMGLQEKTELFLELFGNVLVRKQSEQYVERMANEFVKMVTNFDYLEKKLPVLDLSQLKFKERDFLEAIFKLWRNPEAQVFDVTKAWDLRLRQYLGVRYDSRLNVFDWDLQMRLYQRNAEIISTREYKHWRNVGNAFEIRDGTYDTPNKTMASGLLFKHEGERVAKRGYWGDIIVSPYVALGITCEEKSFFKKMNNVYAKTAQDVAEFNMLSIFHELVTGEKYVLPAQEEKKQKTEEDSGPKITEITEEAAEEVKEGMKSLEDVMDEYQKELEAELANKDHQTTHKTPLDEEYEAIPLENVKITFLPLNSLSELPKKGKYQKLFHIVYFANSLVHLLKPEVNPIFADKATTILESARYMLELKIEKVEEYADKVISIAKAAGCVEEDEFNKDKENFFRFSFERKTS
ncbi:hypothetical protein ACJMK2_019950 [Sinanodonta woodiana]|uniref:Dynein assembly factor 3, axonemal n=1 Tax=Sinanodonta woodiana TaxID=1069815 RepID=A0ABD3TZP3_SINWO